MTTGKEARKKVLERVAAVLQVLNKKDGAFTDEDLAACRNLTDQLAACFPG